MINRPSEVQVASYASAQSGNSAQALCRPKGAAIALAILAFLLPACTSNNPEKVGGPTANTNVSTEEVANKTNALLGKSVTVRSEVEKKVGANSFTIGDEKLFGSEKILVINASGAPTVLPDDIELQVTGKVAKLVVADVEREFNLDLEPELEVEYKDKPAIIAQSIALAPDPGEVTKNPSAFYGKVIAVKGEVEDIVSPNSFRLDEDGLDGVVDNKDLLVLNTAPGQTVKDNQEVVVTGVLRPFVLADFERDYDLNWDLTVQRKLEAEYTQKPVLVTKSVFPAAD
ncbi:hypothetical protein [Coleofasciculus sp. FACHB-1120]|uniref:hypothetical protein n=1 Tax=Coleofasciculus sp. FACHB-1120 TaxID=2692783 RepID=UPI001687350B|nr:hypothetical protein [Coleofasciculus sp. FACHB-1120]MBD2744937.1 hypothetical protein [Coleofasciculus sp. FACHB-1120]